MRIATTQMHTQALNSMLRQQARVQQTELQIASGLSILKPSDDPVGAVKVLNLGSNIGMLEQYERNIAQAQSALGYQETVLTRVNDSLQRIRELTLQANNPANHASARTSIANEMQEQLNALVAAANSRDASGEYLFAGFRVDTPPFTDSGTGIIYNGDQGQRFVAIGEGAQVAVRDAGDAVFMQPQSIFATVGDLVAALNTDVTGTAAQAQLQDALTQGLTGIDQALDGINNQRATVGARLGHIDSVDSINQDFKLQLETVLSATQDLDYAEAITRFNLQLSSLQAAQQAYMKTSGLSLFQYL